MLITHIIHCGSGVTGLPHNLSDGLCGLEIPKFVCGIHGVNGAKNDKENCG